MSDFTYLYERLFMIILKFIFIISTKRLESKPLILLAQYTKHNPKITSKLVQVTADNWWQNIAFY